MAYSQDFRSRAVEYIEEGHTRLEASQVFSINKKTVRKWLDLKAETGSLKPRPHRGGAKPRVTAETLKLYLENHPDDILEDIAKAFEMSIPGAFYGFPFKTGRFSSTKNARLCRKPSRNKGCEINF